MNKLQIINKAISDIRETLDAECTSIERLPELVQTLSKEASRSGYTTSFVFSSRSNPNAPTGGSLDTTTGLVVEIEDEWENSIKDDPVNIFMSFAIFNSIGERVTGWSKPVNLKGLKGDRGEQGPKGEQGPSGDKGADGQSISFRTVTVYTTTDDIDSPWKPVGGKWIFQTNEILCPEGNSVWFLSSEDAPKRKYLWASTGTFNSLGELVEKWSAPFRLTGDDGKDGVDGTLTEFIYRQLPDYTSYGLLWEYLSNNELPSLNEPGYVPYRKDDIAETDWSASPKGITPSMNIEVACSRIRSSINEPWGKWSNCFVWSRWGQNGVDGDGIEYIYLVTPPTYEGKVITKEVVDTIFTPNRQAAAEIDSNYQKDDFCFNKDFGYSSYNWTDTPADIGPDNPMEWIMSRKQVNGKWSVFSEPVLWARHAVKGDSYFTSFVFTRRENPDRPEGGSFEAPASVYPEYWEDSVPEGNTPIWMSRRTFKQGDADWGTGWSDPIQMADTDYFQVEYSSYTNPDDPNESPKITKYTGKEEEWREENPDWSNHVENPVWMATCHGINGEWGDWVISKIKGENGKDGKDGKDGDVGDFSNFNLLANSAELIYNYTGSETTVYGRKYLPITVNAGEQYTFKCELAENLSNDGINTFIIGLAGTNSGREWISNYKTVEFGKNIVVTFTIDDGIQNVKADLCFYKSNAPRTAKAKFNNFSLVKGTVPMSIWQDYQGDNGLKNLINVIMDETYTLGSSSSTSQYVNYQFANFVVNPNESYTFKVDDAKILAGSDTGFNVGIYDARKQEWLSDGPYYVKFGDHNFTTMTIKNTVASNTEGTLVIYAGQAGQTAGKQIQVTKPTLVKGTRPMMVWKSGKTTDIEYLTNTFGEVDSFDGVTLSKAVAVKNSSGKVITIIDGSRTYNELGDITIAAGVDTTASDLTTGINNATLKIFNSGSLSIGETIENNNQGKGPWPVFLKHDGSGWLANGNISWDDKGTLLYEDVLMINMSEFLKNNRQAMQTKDQWIYYTIDVGSASTIILYSKLLIGTTVTFPPNIIFKLTNVNRFQEGREIKFLFFGQGWGSKQIGDEPLKVTMKFIDILSGAGNADINYVTVYGSLSREYDTSTKCITLMCIGKDAGVPLCATY